MVLMYDFIIMLQQSFGTKLQKDLFNSKCHHGLTELHEWEIITQDALLKCTMKRTKMKSFMTLISWRS